MGISLFVRSNRKIQLNQTGEFFADRAAEFLSQGENLLEQVYTYDRNLRNLSIIANQYRLRIWKASSSSYIMNSASGDPGFMITSLVSIS